MVFKYHNLVYTFYIPVFFTNIVVAVWVAYVYFVTPTIRPLEEPVASTPQPTLDSDLEFRVRHPQAINRATDMGVDIGTDKDLFDD